MDVAADVFWGLRRARVFFDIRVFNPHPPSNRHSSLPATYKKHEQEKERQYLQRIRDDENSSFFPLVFSAGGMAKEATIFYKRLASLLAKK